MFIAKGKKLGQNILAKSWSMQKSRNFSLL